MSQVKRKIVFSFCIIGLVVMLIDYNIKSHNMAFYSGKDNGFFVRIISICLLSAFFYGIMAEKNRLLLLVIGFLAGLLSSIISYGIWFFYLVDYGLSFHIIACILFVLIFRVIYYFFPSFLKS